jgi:hypothetical protein
MSETKPSTRKKKILTESEMTKIFDKRMDQFQKSLKDLRQVLTETKRLNQQAEKVQDEIIKWAGKIDKEVEKWEERLVQISKVNLDVEETLSNVLVAIRQNEYLQAYYPAQQGYPEMNVIGRHPCQARVEV